MSPALPYILPPEVFLPLEIFVFGLIQRKGGLWGGWTAAAAGAARAAAPTSMLLQTLKCHSGIAGKETQEEMAQAETRSSPPPAFFLY